MATTGQGQIQSVSGSPRKAIGASLSRSVDATIHTASLSAKSVTTRLSASAGITDGSGSTRTPETRVTSVSPSTTFSMASLTIGKGDTFADGLITQATAEGLSLSPYITVSPSDLQTFTVFTIGGDKIFSGWQFNGQTISGVSEVTETHDSLALTLTTSNWRPLGTLKRNAGFFDSTLGSNGIFRNLDNFNGGNTFVVEPPAIVEPGFEVGTWVGNSYNEKNITRQGETKEIEADFKRVRPKEPLEQKPVDATDPNSWTITGFDDGRITVQRVTFDTERRSEGGAEAISLNFVPRPYQMRWWRHTFQTVEATDIRKIDGGRNYPVDANNDDRNTIYVDPPSTQTRAGTYVVTDWEVSWKGGQQTTVEASLLYGFSGVPQEVEGKPMTPSTTIVVEAEVTTVRTDTKTPNTLDGFGRDVTVDASLSSMEASGRTPALIVKPASD